MARIASGSLFFRIFAWFVFSAVRLLSSFRRPSFVQLSSARRSTRWQRPYEEAAEIREIGGIPHTAEIPGRSFAAAYLIIAIMDGTPDSEAYVLHAAFSSSRHFAQIALCVSLGIAALESASLMAKQRSSFGASVSRLQDFACEEANAFF